VDSTEISLLLSEYLLNLFYIRIAGTTIIRDSYGSGNSGGMAGYKTVWYQTHQVSHANIHANASAGSQNVIRLNRN
jgi:hypothetical protein